MQNAYGERGYNMVKYKAKVQSTGFLKNYV